LIDVRRIMNTSNRLGRLPLMLAICAVVAACLLPSAAHAQSSTTLGSGGELYSVRTGTYKDLFPGQAPPQGVDPLTTALALDVQPAGGLAKRYLVPGTAGSDVELLPGVLYEDAADTVYLIWERRVNNIHPILMLTGFRDGEFSAPLPLVSDTFSDKGHPLVAVSRDSYKVKSGDGSTQTRSRTVLHILWAQDSTAGVETFYAPVLFEDGVYAGTADPFRLNDLDNSDPAGIGFPLPAQLLNTPLLEIGRDGRTVTVGFVSPITQKMLTMELDALPAALSQLGDNARAQIIATGFKVNLANREQIADRVRAAILDLGAESFRPEVVQAIADKVWTTIVTSSPQQTLQALGDNARAQIIATGAQFSGRGLKSFGDNATKIAEVRQQPANGEPDSYPSQAIQFRLTSSRPAPNVGNTSGETRLFVSETGERVIASWLDAPNRLLYRVSDDGTWTDPREIKLSAGLTLKDAYAILDRRVRNQ
jgi:hypothetical protein